jgi:hypothetical protein
MGQHFFQKIWTAEKNCDWIYWCVVAEEEHIYQKLRTAEKNVIADMQLRRNISLKSWGLLKKIVLTDMQICSSGATFLEKVVDTQQRKSFLYIAE